MKDIIEKYKDIIIQIATPHGSGTGFLFEGIRHCCNQ